MKTRLASIPRDLRPPTHPGSVVAIRERDRLHIFHAGLVAITLLFGTLEATFAAAGSP